MFKLTTARRTSPRSLKREIALILVLKVILLFTLWSLWFDHPMPRDQRAANTARLILNR
jgi:hypothetical protein